MHGVLRGLFFARPFFFGSFIFLHSISLRSALISRGFSQGDFFFGAAVDAWCFGGTAFASHGALSRGTGVGFFCTVSRGAFPCAAFLRRFSLRGWRDTGVLGGPFLARRLARPFLKGYFAGQLFRAVFPYAAFSRTAFWPRVPPHGVFWVFFFATAFIAWSFALRLFLHGGVWFFVCGVCFFSFASLFLHGVFWHGLSHGIIFGMAGFFSHGVFAGRVFFHRRGFLQGVSRGFFLFFFFFFATAFFCHGIFFFFFACCFCAAIFFFPWCFLAIALLAFFIFAWLFFFFSPCGFSGVPFFLHAMDFFFLHGALHAVPPTKHPPDPPSRPLHPLQERRPEAEGRAGAWRPGNPYCSPVLVRKKAIRSKVLRSGAYRDCGGESQLHQPPRDAGAAGWESKGARSLAFLPEDESVLAESVWAFAGIASTPTPSSPAWPPSWLTTPGDRGAASAAWLPVAATLATRNGTPAARPAPGGRPPGPPPPPSGRSTSGVRPRRPPKIPLQL
ncbi:SH2 domain-containing protein 5 isoform X3 [Larus michahellis]|uniref:SH2 domain-containing protein 5 isoform X3 n=1 Tax=Larus michahellis TaxID=119627 RepID=UPI003D9B1E64